MVGVAEKVERVLAILVGQPLSDLWRFAGWQRFVFGPPKPFVNSKGQSGAKGDYAIHVLCAWRIVGPEGIIVGSDDYGPDAARRDSSAKPFFERMRQLPLLVQSVKSDHIGSVRLTMTDGYTLDILPTGASPEEHWIFLPPDEGSFFIDKDGFEPVGEVTC